MRSRHLRLIPHGTTTKRSLPAVAIALVGACSLLDPGDTEHDTLRTQRRAWDALAIADYDVISAMSCFCDPETTQPVRISVRDHVTIEVVYIATGRPAPTGRYRNIDELFVWLDEYISDDQNVVDVQYHPVYHFPIDITGNTENALDSGITYRLSEFSQQ